MRLFTLEEANQLIPRLEMIMERLQRYGAELRAGIEAVATELGAAAEGLTLDEVFGKRPQLRTIVEAMQDLVKQVEQCEVQFKGFDLGLVDFPSEINGEIGLLCWQYGEKEITHWHSLEGGFSGRRPLAPAKPRSYLQ